MPKTADEILSTFDPSNPRELSEEEQEVLKAQTKTWFDVHYKEGLFTAVAPNGRILKSTDHSLTWTVPTDEPRGDKPK